LSEENITLRQSEKGLQIVADKVKGQYVAGEGKEYFDDLVKEPAEDTRQDIPLEMVEGLLLARHVTSSDTSKGALCGVKINASTIVATDGRMLVEQTGKSWPEASEILLRRDTLDILAKLNGTPTHWCIEGPRVWFFLDDGTSLGGMILEGDYPDVSKIIAREKLLMKKAILPDALVPALQRHVEQLVEVFDADREVAFNLSPGQILLNSTDTVGVQIEEILEAKGVDCSCSFRVHPSLLLAMLNHTHEMRFAPGEPVVAFEKETDDGRMLHLSSVEWE
jgi:DNA polymerase III sliding clamp (beta) subunit (PCNA family)